MCRLYIVQLHWPIKYPTIRRDKYQFPAHIVYTLSCYGLIYTLTSQLVKRLLCKREASTSTTFCRWNNDSWSISTISYYREYCDYYLFFVSIQNDIKNPYIMIDLMKFSLCFSTFQVTVIPGSLRGLYYPFIGVNGSRPWQM